MLGTIGVANAADFDFAGTIQNRNDVLLFNFTTTAPTSTVTLFTSSWIDGQNGFDPIVGLWDSAGNSIVYLAVCPFQSRT